MLCCAVCVSCIEGWESHRAHQTLENEWGKDFMGLTLRNAEVTDINNAIWVTPLQVGHARGMAVLERSAGPSPRGARRPCCGPWGIWRPTRCP